MPSGSLADRWRGRWPLRRGVLARDLGEQHGGQAGGAKGGEHRGRGIGPGEQVVRQQRDERRAGQVVARAEQRVAQPAGVILRHELELERTLVVAGGGLEHRLVRVGDDDGAEEAGVGGFVERPVEHGLSPTGRISLGSQRVIGCSRVPRPPHGITAVSTIMRVSCTPCRPNLVRAARASKAARMDHRGPAERGPDSAGRWRFRSCRTTRVWSCWPLRRPAICSMASSRAGSAARPSARSSIPWPTSSSWPPRSASWRSAAGSSGTRSSACCCATSWPRSRSSPRSSRTGRGRSPPAPAARR